MVHSSEEVIAEQIGRHTIQWRIDIFPCTGLAGTVVRTYGGELWAKTIDRNMHEICDAQIAKNFFFYRYQSGKYALGKPITRSGGIKGQ